MFAIILFYHRYQNLFSYNIGIINLFQRKETIFNISFEFLLHFKNKAAVSVNYWDIKFSKEN